MALTWGHRHRCLLQPSSASRFIAGADLAPGGELDYVVRGNMIGGFALVAYPAEYRTSGLMTFLVNHHGDIYEKDLGWRTAAIASGMTSFDPDDTWRRGLKRLNPRVDAAKSSRLRCRLL